MALRIHHIPHKQFGLGFVNGRIKQEDCRRGAQADQRACDDLPLVPEEHVENVLQIQAGRLCLVVLVVTFYDGGFWKTN